MDNEFSGIPNDERIRRVCELIEGAIERSRLYRKTVLLPPPPPSSPSPPRPSPSPSPSPPPSPSPSPLSNLHHYHPKAATTTTTTTTTPSTAAAAATAIRDVSPLNHNVSPQPVTCDFSPVTRVFSSFARDYSPAARDFSPAATPNVPSSAPQARRSTRGPKRRLSPPRRHERSEKHRRKRSPYRESEPPSPLPPLRDRLLRHMSCSAAAAAGTNGVTPLSACDRPPLHSASSAMASHRLPLRSRTSTELSLGASLSRKELLRSPATTAPPSPHSDSKIKRMSEGKKARWNPVPQATLMRAHIRAEAAERRAMQTFAEGPRRDTRRRLSEMLSWDPKNKCFLPPQATLMRALARQKRVEEQRASMINAAMPSTFPSRSQRSVSAASYLQRRRTRDVAAELTAAAAAGGGRSGARSALASRRYSAASGGGGFGGGSGGSGAGLAVTATAAPGDAVVVAAARAVSLSAPTSLVVGLPPVLRRAVNASANDASRLGSSRLRPHRHRIS